MLSPEKFLLTAGRTKNLPFEKDKVVIIEMIYCQGNSIVTVKYLVVQGVKKQQIVSIALVILASDRLI